MNWRLYLSHLDQLMKTGQGHQAQKSLASLPIFKIPREYLEPLSSLARRLNMPYLSLKILSKIIRSDRPIHPPPLDAELASYGMSLIRVGAFSEGMEFLNSVNEDSHPQVLLFQAIGLISRWKYRASVPILKKYIHRMKSDPYQKLVGQLNLVNAYVFLNEQKKSLSLLEPLTQNTLEGGYTFLYANCLQAHAVLAIYNQEFTQAESWLNKSSQLLINSKGLQEFFARKWKTINELMKNKQKESNWDQFYKIREEARKRSHGETLRDCDFFEAKIKNDENLIQKLLYGTPHLSYRKNLRGFFNDKIQLRSSYDWNLGEDFINKNSSIFDVKKELSEFPGQILHKTFLALCKDFYRPVSLGQLHSEIFETEHFNPQTSPDRVAKIIKRLRKHFTDKKIPLKVTCHQKTFLLNASMSCVIRLSKNQKIISKNETLIQKLKSIWPYQAFSCSMASRLLKSSLSTTHRLLAWGVQNHLVSVSGQARGTRYFFKKGLKSSTIHT